MGIRQRALAVPVAKGGVQTVQQNARENRPAAARPLPRDLCDLWEPVVWRLLDEVEELEARGVAVYRRRYLAVRKEVFREFLHRVAPDAPLGDVLRAWGAQNLLQGHPSDGWTKAVRLRDGSVRRMLVIPMAEEE